MADEHGRDGCSCTKSAGCWGSGGWHFYVLDEAQAVAKMRRMWDQDHPEEAAKVVRIDQLRGEARKEAERERDHRDKLCRLQARHYVGARVAYEPCPEYRKAVAGDEARERFARGRKAAGGVVGEVG